MGIFLSLGMALMGLNFGPMSALLPELFPTNTRYTGSGIAYNLASILGAALTPFVATWLAQKHGAGSVGLYLALLGVISIVALFLSKETKHTNLDTMQTEPATTGIESTSP
jgi:MFS family permease